MATSIAPTITLIITAPTIATSIAAPHHFHPHHCPHHRPSSSSAHAQALLDGGAAAEPADAYGDTPLHWAAARGHAVVARMLVTRGGARLRSNQPLILTLTPTLTLTLTLTPTLTLALTLALTLTLTPR